MSIIINTPTLIMDQHYLKIREQLGSDLPRLYAICYKTNNRFAYKQDLTGISPDDELKVYNFTPTYDRWCLFCNKQNCTFRCSKCKVIYYCGAECQKKSWPIHKKHCGRDLFCVCSFCGRDNPGISCDKCPVKFCNDACKNKIYKAHQEFDCDNYRKMFNK